MLLTELPICNPERYILSWFRGMTIDGIWIGELDLLTTCTHHWELPFTDHWHTEPNVLILLQFLLAVSWQRLLPREILRLPALKSSCHSRMYRAFVRCQLTTNWIPGWRPFHTNLLVFSSHVTFNWPELSHSPTSYFTSLLFTELLTSPTPELDWPCLQHFGTNHTENTVFHLTLTVASVSVAAGARLPSSCPAIARVLLTCLPAVTKQRMFPIAIVA
jgi:hypothetical protein